MKKLLKNLKMSIYCNVVNQNAYVRDLYQLPSILDPDYHSNHRVKEWFRLVKLIIVFRVLKKNPTQAQIDEIQYLQNKVNELYKDNGCVLLESEDDTSQRTKRIVSEIRQSVSNAIEELRQADLFINQDIDIILLCGSEKAENTRYLISMIENLRLRNNSETRIICLSPTNEQQEKFACFTIPKYFVGFTDGGNDDEIVLDNSERSVLREIRGMEQIAIKDQRECIGEKYFTLICAELYLYFRELCDIFQPKLALIWDEPQLVAEEAKTYCNRMGIPNAVVSMDALGGGYVIEGDRKEETKDIQLSKNIDAVYKSSIIAYLENVKKSARKEYIARKELFLKCNQTKPTVLLTGSLEDNLVIDEDKEGPDNDCLISVVDCVNFFEKICKTNRWNLILKFDGITPVGTAIDASHYELEDLFDLCNVVVALNEVVAWFALAYEKPVVMIGNSDKTMRGSCYYPGRLDDMSKIIETAISKGVTTEQRERYVDYLMEKSIYFATYVDAECVEISKENMCHLLVSISNENNDQQM